MTDFYNDDTNLSNFFKDYSKNYDEIKEIPNFNNDIRTLSSAASLFDQSIHSFNTCTTQINTNLYLNINTEYEFDQLQSLHSITNMTNIINNEVTFFDCSSSFRLLGRIKKTRFKEKIKLKMKNGEHKKVTNRVKNAGCDNEEGGGNEGIKSNTNYGIFENYDNFNCNKQNDANSLIDLCNLSNSNKLSNSTSTCNIGNKVNSGGSSPSNSSSNSNKLFIIHKQPKQRCVHRHKSKLHKNELKKMVKKDFIKCIKGQPEYNTLGFGNFNFEKLLKKNNNFSYSSYLKIRKKLKKGKIRIFDDDL